MALRNGRLKIHMSETLIEFSDVLRAKIYMLCKIYMQG
jgi:hypothetical protein